MAYTQRYKSIFYNRKNQECILYIYEDGFSGQWENITVSGCSISYRKEDYIITMSMDINITNNTGDFHTYDDMVMAQERSFIARLYVDATLEFEGFLIPDIMEQELLDYAEIRMTFTDYLKRLKDIDAVGLTLGKKSFLINYIKDALNVINYPVSLDIRVNANLFPTEVTRGYPGYTNMYELVEIVDDVFFTDLEEVVSAWEVLQEILKITQGFLFYYRGNWYIEHYNVINVDDTWPGNWTQFLAGESSAYQDSGYDPDGTDPGYGLAEPLGTQVNPINPYNKINKQDGDFKYAERSQLIQYRSGLKELEISVQRNLYDTLVNNNFSSDPVYSTFSGSSAVVGTWRVAENVVADSVFAWRNHYGIAKYIKWQVDETQPNRQGIFQAFRFSFNSEGLDSDPTMLHISYKWSTYNFNSYTDDGDIVQFIGRFAIKNTNHLDPYHNQYLGQDVDGNLKWDDNDGLPLDLDNNIWKVYIDASPEVKEKKTIEISQTIDLTSISDDSGALTDQEFALVILPTEYRYASGSDDIEDNTERIIPIQIVGDVNVNVSAQTSNNIRTYTVSDDFVNKKSIEIKVFDTPNLNYKNALIFDGQRTSEWGTGYNDDPNEITYTDNDSIVNHLAKALFSYGSETRLQLRAQILIDNMVKPLTIIEDDNIYKDSTGGILEFVLFEFEYNVVENTMQIIADEYGDEEINIIES